MFLYPYLQMVGAGWWEGGRSLAKTSYVGATTRKPRGFAAPEYPIL